MRLALLLTAFVAAPVFADNKEDLKAMAGTWVAEKFEIDGTDMLDSFKDLQLVIDGETYTVTVNKMTDKGTLSIDASKTPKTMDVVGKEGTNKDRKYLCIYELKDGKLTVCYSMDDKNRPDKFTTAKDSNRILAVYKPKK